MVQTHNNTTRLRKQSECAILPNLTIEAIQHGIRVLDVLLCLLSHVEDRTITTRAKNVLKRGCNVPCECGRSFNDSLGAATLDTAGIVSTDARTGPAARTPS